MLTSDTDPIAIPHPFLSTLSEGGLLWQTDEHNADSSWQTDAQWRAPTDGAPTGSVANERQTALWAQFPMQRMITNQEQQNKYPCYRIRDTQSL